MANTYTQIHIQTVFSVQDRLCLISGAWKNELFKYITGIINNCGHKTLAINGMPDHIHILFGMRPTQSLSDLMQDIKGSSSKWINNKKLCSGRFSWQEGYGAFSYSKSDVQNVINYIRNQENHHSDKTFLKEYMSMLEEFDVIFDDKYVFRAVDQIEPD
jgi:putative transposase